MVEYLVLNGANPLILDASRHNSCLIWAAAHAHADCVARLLRGSHELPGGRACAIGEIPCFDEDDRCVLRVCRVWVDGLLVRWYLSCAWGRRSIQGSLAGGD